MHINSRQQFVIEEEAHQSQKSSEESETRKQNRRSDGKIGHHHQKESHRSIENLNLNKVNGGSQHHSNNQLHFIKSKNGSP